MASLCVQGKTLGRMHEEYNNGDLVLITRCLFNLLDGVEIVLQPQQPECVSAHFQPRLNIEVFDNSKLTNT